MKGLPPHLTRAVATQSVTVQELIFEVALHAAGMPAELPPKPDSGIEGAWRRNHPTPEDTDGLREYLYGRAPTEFIQTPAKRIDDAGPQFVDRCAIGVAALAGRTAKEIDRFFGWEDVARYRLKWLRKLVRSRLRQHQDPQIDEHSP